MIRKNAIEMYSTHNKGKYVVVERFIRTLNEKIYKYKTSIPKYVFIDKLDDIANIYIYRNTYHETIRMKPADVNCCGYMLLVIFKVKKCLERFTNEKELEKPNQRQFRIRKVIKRKGDKLYVKWKSYESFFNNWIDKKDRV